MSSTDSIRTRVLEPGRISLRSASRGATLVEFALVAPLFLFLVWGIIAGAWYVLEVSAVSNAAREAASWEAAGANFVTVGGISEPYCMDSGNTVPPGLISAAAATAGPFSQEVRASSSITNTPTSSNTCTVTITVPYTPLASLLPIGPTTIKAASTIVVSPPQTS